MAIVTVSVVWRKPEKEKGIDRATEPFFFLCFSGGNKNKLYSLMRKKLWINMKDISLTM